MRTEKNRSQTMAWILTLPIHSFCNWQWLQLEKIQKSVNLRYYWVFYLKLGFHMPVRDVGLDLRRSLTERMKKLRLIRPNTTTPATSALVTASSGEEESLDGAIIDTETERQAFNKKPFILLVSKRRAHYKSQNSSMAIIQGLTNHNY